MLAQFKEFDNKSIGIFESLNYDEFLDLQLKLCKIVKEDRSKEYHIICNHSPLFTHGRGLQKNTGQNLTPHDFSKNLPAPFYKINRGGGLTFHHPGQVILYSIINLERKDWDLKKHYCFLMKVIKETILEYTDIDLNCSTDLAGIWYGTQKIASVGVGIERFVTCHGIALNLNIDHKTRELISITAPCGLNNNTYTGLEDLRSLSINFNDFCKILEAKIISYSS